MKCTTTVTLDIEVKNGIDDYLKQKDIISFSSFVNDYLRKVLEDANSK